MWRESTHDFTTGVVTDEMLAAVDWLPTLAGLAGASNLVPKDRPIDGKDASAFLLGKSPTTGRNFYTFFGGDGSLLSVKWQYYKYVFRYTPGPAEQAVNVGYVEPPLPMIFDLSSDPHEDYNLWNATIKAFTVHTSARGKFPPSVTGWNHVSASPKPPGPTVTPLPRNGSVRDLWRLWETTSWVKTWPRES